MSLSYGWDGLFNVGQGSGNDAFYMIGNVSNMVRGSAATSSYDINESLAGPFFEIMSGVFGPLIILTHGIG
jgi:hypothetical protein